MSKLYNIVERIINTESLEEAKDIFYGKNGIKLDRTEYYQNIIANFIKKREVVIKKENDMFYFDLSNINDIWNIIFLAEYIKENDENYKNYKEQLNIIEKEQKELSNIVVEKMKNCVKGSSEYIELSKMKSRILKQDKIARINVLKANYSETLEIFDSPTNIVNLYKGKENLKNIINRLKVNNPDIKENVFEDLKKAIHILYKFRNTFEHGKEILPEPELKIEKQGFSVNIPIKYLDGFNKGKVIVEEKDQIILKKTNQKSQPILQCLGYDIKEIESFFYNVEPCLLSYLLEKVNYDYNELYELPVGIFLNFEHTKKIIKQYGLSITEIKDLPFGVFEYPDAIKLLIEEYGFSLEEIKKLPDSAFENLENTEKLIYECGFNFEILKDLSYYAFENFEHAQKLIYECGFAFKDLKDLPDFAFFEPENTKKLIYECGFAFEDLKDLPKGAFSKPENTQKLIKQYGVSITEIKDLPFEAFEYPDAIKLLMEEYGLSITEIKDLPFGVFEYPDAIKLLIEECGFSLEEIKKLPDSAFENLENTEKLIYECGFSFEVLKDLSGYSFYFPNTIKTLIEEFGFAKEEIKELPDFAFLEFNNLKKLIKEYDFSKEEIKELPDSAFINPNTTKILMKEYGLPLKILREIFGSRIYMDEFTEYTFFEFTKGMHLAPGIYKKLNFNNIKEENLKFLIEKVGESYEKLEEFPVEFFECDFCLLDEMFQKYNSNLNKSIFGLDNPKIISLLVYMHSVFSRIDDKDINIDLNEFIIKTNYNTLKYKDNITAKNMDQNEYIRQIENHNILQKLRNMSVHFRFKLVTDENNEESLLYLYDEDNQGNNNFNIIIDIKDLLEITRKIEEQMVSENINGDEKQKTR